MSPVPPPPGGGAAPPPPPLGGAPSATSRNWAVVAHLSAFVVFLGVPLPFLGPLIVWLVRRDTDPWAAEHGREALNFNLTAMIALLASGLSILLLVGIVLLPAVAIVWVVFIIIAAVKASSGERYRYPLTIRFVS